jgi:hypothetical protein
MRKELAIAGVCLFVAIGLIILVEKVLVPSLGGSSDREVVLYLETTLVVVIVSSILVTEIIRIWTHLKDFPNRSDHVTWDLSAIYLLVVAIGVSCLIFVSCVILLTRLVR